MGPARPDRTTAGGGSDAARDVRSTPGCGQVTAVISARIGAVVGALVSALLGTAAGALPATPAISAPPADAECRPVQGHQMITERPWHVRANQPDRIWPLATGAGITVAVVDSGVDAGHPQLSGRVDAGRDFLYGSGTANNDCVGHGTAVAGIIAARPAGGIGFVGLAPGARILPVRVSEQPTLDTGQGRGSVDPGGFAAAIRYAVDSGARVMNLSVYLSADDPRIRDAVRYARARDVVVVAAAGNLHSAAGNLSSAADQPDPVLYPAGYDGVIGVGAVDNAGVRWARSQVGPDVDLVAPGVSVTVPANRSHDYWTAEGTSFAAPHVAAAAALVRSRWPRMTADEVTARLLATADPAAGGRAGGEYGHGIVNPYRAVTEVLPPGGSPQPATALAPSRGDPAARADARARQVGAGIVTAVAGLTALTVTAVWVVRRGRRRGWRAGYAPAGQPAEPVDDTAFSWTVRVPEVRR
jgi:type VII secretion-associated serine protease mycosin